MQDYAMVGANFSVAIAGLIVGIYFSWKVFTLRGKVDENTMNLFIAIAAGAIFGSVHKIYTLPIYLRRVDSDAFEKWVINISQWTIFMVLVFCAFAYILHLKPVFYWISRRAWTAISLAIVLTLVCMGAFIASMFSTFP